LGYPILVAQLGHGTQLFAVQLAGNFKFGAVLMFKSETKLPFVGIADPSNAALLLHVFHMGTAKGFYIGLFHSSGPIGSWHPAFCSAAYVAIIKFGADLMFKSKTKLPSAGIADPSNAAPLLHVFHMGTAKGFYTLGYSILVAQLGHGTQLFAVQLMGQISNLELFCPN
jgi:putative Ca2+/H+ antiporter (TMEM165/GDT1 family)